MKPIKVFFNGKALREIYPHATRWQVWKFRAAKFVRKLMISSATIAALAGLVYGSFQAGSKLSPVTVYAEKQVEVPVIQDSPVLQRIAKCESATGHYDTNGQVVVHPNANGSVDVGKYEINMKAWGKKATELGLNLMDEKDNETMARWIYANRGTGDWYSSESCWNK